MRAVEYATAFRKDYRRLQRSPRHDLAELKAVVAMLAQGAALPERLRDLLMPGRTPPEVLEMQRIMTMVGRSYSLRGGTREILRGIIARGLGLR